jgi:DNA-binding transcriptional LysR family regulator
MIIFAATASRRVRFKLDRIEHIAQFVAAGFGVSIFPD